MNLEQRRRNPHGLGDFLRKGKSRSRLFGVRRRIWSPGNRNLPEVFKVNGQAYKSREGEGITQRAAEEKSQRFALCSGKQEQLRASPPAPKKAELGHQERKAVHTRGRGSGPLVAGLPPRRSFPLPRPTAPVGELRDPQLRFVAAASPVASPAGPGDPGEGPGGRCDTSGSHLPPSALTPGMRVGLCGAGFT